MLIFLPLILSILFLPCIIDFVNTVNNNGKLFVGFLLVMVNIVNVVAMIHNQLSHIK